MDSLAFFEHPTVSLAETSLLSPSPSDTTGSPAPSSYQDEKKQVKKRKSWGQELPTPKTNLPPRKRAKTEDEKEQRRIERVLRNRQAAQSSRERKRQEVEKLEGERDVIHHENRALKARLLATEEEKFQMQQQLAEMRELLRNNGLHVASPPTSPIISASMFKGESIKQEADEFPSLYESSRSHTVDPRASLSPSPKETTDDSDDLDLAQHPAVVLCGLPCQSKAQTSASLPMALPDATLLSRQLHQHLLFLTVHSTICSTLTAPLFQLLTSLKKGSAIQAETLTPTMFTLITWLISTPTSPLRPSTPKALPSAATASTTTSLSTSTPPTTRSSTFRTSLLRRLLTCSPALARPLRNATARALREKTEYALRGKHEGRSRDGAEGKSGLVVAVNRRPMAEVFWLITLAALIDRSVKEREQRRSRRKVVNSQ